MYQFLYLFGPGVASWLVGGLCAGFSGEDRGIFLTVARVITYALVDTAIVTVICKPLGRVQFVVLQDGSITIHYGAFALAVATVVAIVAGTAIAAIENRYHRAGCRSC